MVPYVRKSFFKHFKDGMTYIMEDDSFNNISNDEFWNVFKNIDDIKLINEYHRAHKYAMDMTKKEAQQSAEAMFHNLCSLQSRSGNQLPFSSINFGTCTSPEGRMIIDAVLQGSLNGIGKLHRTSIFPCCIFQYMKGVNDKSGTPNYDLYRKALKCTAKRLYPNYANVDWSGNAGYDRNDPRTYFSTINKTVA